MTELVDAIPELFGEHYQTLLARLHECLKPASYFEIGTNTGGSLSHARCPSIAVDPAFTLEVDITFGKDSCHLYRMTSDHFFSDYDPVKILGRNIDFVFLDGMHLFEFLLRDFMNIERACKKNSLIVLHDCMPTDVYMASRVDNFEDRQDLSTRPEWWTGDVWKVPLILKKYRPDLQIYAVDAAPTGLIFITNLDPSSTVIRTKHLDICQEFQNISLTNYGLERYHAELKTLSTNEFRDFSSIARFFWL